jgi:hypothetical protein
MEYFAIPKELLKADMGPLVVHHQRLLKTLKTKPTNLFYESSAKALEGVFPIFSRYAD